MIGHAEKIVAALLVVWIGAVQAESRLHVGFDMSGAFVRASADDVPEAFGVRAVLDKLKSGGLAGPGQGEVFIHLVGAGKALEASEIRAVLDKLKSGGSAGPGQGEVFIHLVGAGKALEASEIRAVLDKLKSGGFAGPGQGEVFILGSDEVMKTSRIQVPESWADYVAAASGRMLAMGQYDASPYRSFGDSANVCPRRGGEKVTHFNYLMTVPPLYAQTNHDCMDYGSSFRKHTGGQPYSASALAAAMAERARGVDTDEFGNFIAWKAGRGDAVLSVDESFPGWVHAFATGGYAEFRDDLERSFKRAGEAYAGTEAFVSMTRSRTFSEFAAREFLGKHDTSVHFSGGDGSDGIGMAWVPESVMDGWMATSANKGRGGQARIGGVLTIFVLPG